MRTKIAADSISSRTAPCLDLEEDAELVVDRVDLVRDALPTLLTVQHGSANLLVSMLARLDLEAESLEAGTEVFEDPIARQALDRVRID